jgi:hypothetical protein
MKRHRFLSLFLSLIFICSGTISPIQAASFHAETQDVSLARSGHTATLLFDGRLMISGGQTSAGQPTNQVEIFDPVLNLERRYQ